MKCLSGNLCLKGIEMPQFKLNPYLMGIGLLSHLIIYLWRRNLTDEFYDEYSGYSSK